LSSHRDHDTASARDPRSAWHRLLELSSRVLRELDDALASHHRITVTEFDVLITLHNTPDRRLRMTDLARATLLSSGGLTRLVARLETRGLVRRDPDADDGRAFRATLTPDGDAMLEQARITHDAVLERMIAPHVTPRDVHALERTLGKILAGNEP
jgi:DNA-binding MarR family transcriptional regulator